MSKYFIGIDGGGTKTLGVLWNEDGKEIKRVEYGFANFAVNVNITKANIEKTVADLLEGINEKVRIIMGIAGVSSLKDHKKYTEYLESLFNADVTIETDGYLALYSVRNENKQPVIMIIGGTGSIAYGLDKDKMVVVGGYGHLMGDDGSAYHLVISALKFIIHEDEFKDEFSDFSKQLMKEFKIKDVKELKSIVYGEQKSAIADHAQKINKLAEDGDLVAKTLLEKEGELLARQVVNTYRKLNSNETVKVALRGGFLQKAMFVKETFVKELEKYKLDFIIDEENLEPVMGAYHIMIESRGGQNGRHK